MTKIKRLPSQEVTRMPRFCILLSLWGINLFGQTAGMSARQLYLQDDPAPNQKPNKGSKAKTAIVPANPTDNRTTDSTTSGNLHADGAVMPVALHLGLRYNILLYSDTADKNPREVDPETRFRSGDCIAVRFHPNRNGHIYVFNQGSSGVWQAMFPSPLMPTESNLVVAGADRKVPEDYCFKIGGPPGTDLLLVVLTEKEEDMYKLNDAIRRSVRGESSEPATPTSTPPGIGQVVMAMQVNPDSDHLRPGQSNPTGDLTSRDLSVQFVGQPQSPDEPPNSVYVVKPAAAKSDRMVLQISLKHD